MPKQNTCKLVFPTDAAHQPAPPGVYEIRYYVRGNPVPMAVTDPITSRWPKAEVEPTESSVTCGWALRVKYCIDVKHADVDHYIHLCPVSAGTRAADDSATPPTAPVDVIKVPAGSMAGELTFRGSHITPRKYVAEYRMSNDYNSIRLARSSACVVRVSDAVDQAAMASRIFRIYLAANAGMEMAAERAQVDDVVNGPLRELCRQHGWSVAVIDLRATPTDSADPRLLGCCMQGIEDCRGGAFICLLGEKYGEVISSVPPQSETCLVTKPWLTSIRNTCLAAGAQVVYD